MISDPAATRAPVTPPSGAGVVGIVLVDDHAIVRQGLRSVLERERDLRIVGEASTADDAMAVVERTRPAVVLLDLKLSTGADSQGLELCSWLTTRYPGLGVLVLTTFLDDNLVAQAIHRGARGYVIKDVDTTELVRAIRAVVRNESAFDSRSAAAMVRSLRLKAEQPVFTERELKVLRALAHGMSNKEIGQQLYISETTVKFHVRNIMRKMDAASRAEAVYEASKLGVICPRSVGSQHQPATVVLADPEPAPLALPQPDQISAGEALQVPVGGGGLILERHGDHDPVTGEPDRLPQRAIAVLRSQVLQQVDGGHGVRRARGQRYLRRVADKGLQGVAQRPRQRTEEPDGAGRGVRGDHAAPPPLRQQQRKEAEAGSDVEHPARRDEPQCPPVDGREIADGCPRLAGLAGRPPALAYPVHRVGVEGQPGGHGARHA